jgi:hypothetical protein
MHYERGKLAEHTTHCRQHTSKEIMSSRFMMNTSERKWSYFSSPRESELWLDGDYVPVVPIYFRVDREDSRPIVS